MGGWLGELVRRWEGRALGSDNHGHFLALLLTLGWLVSHFSSLHLLGPLLFSGAQLASRGKERLVCELLDERHSLLWRLPVVEGMDERHWECKFKAGEITFEAIHFIEHLDP